MSKKIYSGAYLFESNNKKQFGSIDSAYFLDNKKDYANVIFRKEDLIDISIDDDFISLKFSLEQLEEIASKLQTVSERMKFLKLLHQNNKLNSNAYMNFNDE